MSKRTSLLLAAAATAIVSGVLYASTSSRPPLQTVAHLDLSRYLGRWYEIARYPNRFEAKCDRDVTADYSLRADHKITVVNACTKSNGERTEARGWAKISDPTTNAKLKVTFFWPFFGNYWVLDLGPNYEYTVIGEPRRKYLWILSRTPHLSDDQYRSITSRLAAKGYDIQKLIRVTQTAH